jgi:hypothetical protein
VSNSTAIATPVDRHKNCAVCACPVRKFGQSVVLGSHAVDYFQCDSCGFLQTENPHWLDEAYASPIASLDLGLLHRNQRFAAITFRLLRWVLKPDANCIDYGGGYGVFSRLMRDRGIPFFHYDPMAENLFARSFTGSVDDSFELATAFEVLEHLVDPHDHFELLDRLAPNWLLSTELLPDATPALDDWWYYLQETGQHVSFFSRRSLEKIAARYGRRLISSGTGLHFFTKSKMPRSYIRWALRGRTSRLLDRVIRRPSLLQSDFIYVKSLLRQEGTASLRV